MHYNLGPGPKCNCFVKSIFHHIVGNDKAPQTAFDAVELLRL